MLNVIKKHAASILLLSMVFGLISVVISCYSLGSETPNATSGDDTQKKKTYDDTKPVVYKTRTTKIALANGATTTIAISEDNRGYFFPKDQSLKIATDSTAIEATVSNSNGTITFTTVDTILDGSEHTFTLTYEDNSYQDYTLDFTVTADASVGTLQVTAPETMTYGDNPITLSAMVGGGIPITTYIWTVHPQGAGTLVPSGDNQETATFTLTNVGEGTVTIGATMTSGGTDYSGNAIITLQKAEYIDPKPIVYGTTATKIGLANGATTTIAISEDNRGYFFPKDQNLKIVTDSTAIEATVSNSNGTITFTTVGTILDGSEHTFTLTYEDNSYQDYTLDFTVTGINITVSVASSSSSMTYGDNPITLSATINGEVPITEYAWTVTPQSAGILVPSGDNQETATFTLTNVGEGTVTIGATMTSGGVDYSGNAIIALQKAEYSDLKPIVYGTTATEIALANGATTTIAISEDNRGNFSPKDQSLKIATDSTAIEATVSNSNGTITFTTVDTILDGSEHTFTLTYEDNSYQDYTLDFTVTADASVGTLQVTAPETMTYGDNPITLSAMVDGGIPITTYIWTVHPQGAGTLVPSGDNQETATFTPTNVGEGTVTIGATMTSGGVDYSGNAIIALQKAEYSDLKPIVYGTTATEIALANGATTTIAISEDNRGDFSPKDQSLKIATDSTAIEATVSNSNGTITFTTVGTTLDGSEHTFTLTYEDKNYKDYTVVFTVTSVSIRVSDLTLSYDIKAAIATPLNAEPNWDTIPTATYSIDPSELPGGLIFDTEDGTITGTPTTGGGGLYTVTAAGTDNYDGTIAVTFPIIIFLAPVTESNAGTAIENRATLEKIGKDPKFPLRGTYHLSANIDLSGTNWDPIGSEANPFTGTLHGNGYVVYNLNIAANSSNYQGLFAKIEGISKNRLAIIENLAVGFGTITANAAVGALAGMVDNYSTLINLPAIPMDSNSEIKATGEANPAQPGSYAGGLVGWNNTGSVNGYAMGTVTGANNQVGGLLGYNEGTVSGYATGAVSGENRVGGLVGYVAAGSTVSGYATGAVTGAGHVGGLVGYALSGSTVSGYATGDVTSTSTGTTSNFVGGLVGVNRGTVSGYATGDVTSTGTTSNFVGGLVGINNGGTVSGYATGGVTNSGNSNSQVGGLVGNNNNGGMVSGYATGAVTGTASDFGGLVGVNNGGTVSGYWDKASTKQSSSAGGTGISATKNIALDNTTYTDSGATDPSAAIFNDATFLTVFELPGTAKTWPKLKASYTFNSTAVSFGWKQPTVSDTNDDGEIEVSPLN